MNVRVSLVLVVLMSLLPAVVSANFYRYYDENGGINVTNDYKSIPERYRAGVTVTTDKQLENKSKARDRQERSGSSKVGLQPSQQLQQAVPSQNVPTESAPAPSEAQKEPITKTSSTSWLSRQLPMLKVMGVIGLLMAGFVVVGRVASSLAPRSLAIVIKIAMIAAIGVFLTRGFSEKIADAFGRIKDESAVAQKAVDKRSEKIQQQAE